MKAAALLLCLAVCSCGSIKKLPIPEAPQKAQIDSLKPPAPIIYKIVKQEEDKKGMSDETIRLLIAEFFSTISTIIAVLTVQDSATP